MNCFFALNLDNFDNIITIPKFTNEGKKIKNCSLFTAIIDEDEWFVKKYNCKEDNDFFYLEVPTKEKENLFFLAKSELSVNTKYKTLEELEHFNNIRTRFTFRANLKLYKKDTEFSSYQSEYPIEMTKKNGAILTPVNSFQNINQDNFMIFKQIFNLPLKIEFSIYLINFLSNKVILKKNFRTNSTNYIDLTNVKDLNNCFFYSEKYLGIPLFISFGKKEGISMEHSHPPHIYMLSPNKYEIISNLKLKAKKIVDN